MANYKVFHGTATTASTSTFAPRCNGGHGTIACLRSDSVKADGEDWPVSSEELAPYYEPHGIEFLGFRVKAYRFNAQSEASAEYRERTREKD